MQLKSSLISFNHHFDSPVIPTKGKSKLLIIGSLDFFFILSKSSSFTCAHFANHFVIYLEVDSQPRQCRFSCFLFSDIIDLSIYISVQAHSIDSFKLHQHRLSIADAQKKRDAPYALNYEACPGKETPVGLTACTTPVGAKHYYINRHEAALFLHLIISITSKRFYFQTVSWAFWFNAK